MKKLCEKKYSLILLYLIFILNLYSGNAFSQIEIVDQSHQDNSELISADESGSVLIESAELLLKVQNLERELRFLRGSVEELNYILDQLRQNRIKDYLDLDQRLTTINSVIENLNIDISGVKNTNLDDEEASSVINKIDPQNQSKLPKSKLFNNPSVESSYRAAYQLVKEQQFKKATLEFIAFIEKNNDSYFTPKAYFWLGELYYWAEEYRKSKDFFSKLINEYPDHKKVPDSEFKIGKILFNLGQKKAAKNQIEILVKRYPTSPVLNPAKEFLRNNF